MQCNPTIAAVSSRYADKVAGVDGVSNGEVSAVTFERLILLAPRHKMTGREHAHGTAGTCAVVRLAMYVRE